MSKRLYNRTQLRAFKVGKHWARCWEEYPERMELNRRHATEAAKKSKDAKRQRQIEALRSWPAVMATAEYKALLTEAVNDSDKKERKPDSLRRKFQKHKLVTFDPLSRAWINHTKQPE